MPWTQVNMSVLGLAAATCVGGCGLSAWSSDARIESTLNQNFQRGMKPDAVANQAALVGLRVRQLEPNSGVGEDPWILKTELADRPSLIPCTFWEGFVHFYFDENQALTHWRFRTLVGMGP